MEGHFLQRLPHNFLQFLSHSGVFLGNKKEFFFIVIPDLQDGCVERLFEEEDHFCPFEGKNGVDVFVEVIFVLLELLYLLFHDLYSLSELLLCLLLAC